MVTFDLETGIPDLQGRTFFVTGGNSGLGAETVKQLAKYNAAEIWLAARTRSTASAVIEEIKESIPTANIIPIDLDLGSFDSIKAAAAHFNGTASRLDVLVLNAGVAFMAPALTESGFEVHLGINHVGHALLAQLLLPKILETATIGADVRIVSLSSRGERDLAPKSGLDLTVAKTTMADYSRASKYGLSKLANIQFARELAFRYPSVKVVSVHPGAIMTGLGRGFAIDHPWIAKAVILATKPFLTTVEEGVKNQLWAAFGDNVKTGEYYEPIGIPGRASKQATDPAASAKLWDWTVEQLKEAGFGNWPPSR